MKALFARLLPARLVASLYAASGTVFGEAVSYIPIAGPCIGFEKYFRRWEFWEREYARRGYRTLGDELFVLRAFGSMPNAALVGHLMVKRDKGERAMLYAVPLREELEKEKWFKDML